MNGALDKEKRGKACVDFNKLTYASLQRYRKFYKLPPLGRNPSKAELVTQVSGHFVSQVLDMNDDEIVETFIARTIQLK